MGDTFYLIPLGIAAIMSSSVFFYAGFLFLAPPREDTIVAKMRPHEATCTAPAPATPSPADAPPLPNSVPHEATCTAPAPAARSPAVAPPSPNSVPHEATQTAPAPAAPSLAVAPPLPNSVPHEATQTAPAPAITPNYLASVSRFFAVFSQKAQEKGMNYEQYRARLQYLHKQQTGIELRLADPNLSTMERLQLERQYAYWGRAIREMLALP
jgi:hypothetical protein